MTPRRDQGRPTTATTAKSERRIPRVSSRDGGLHFKGTNASTRSKKRRKPSVAYVTRRPHQPPRRRHSALTDILPSWDDMVDTWRKPTPVERRVRSTLQRHACAAATVPSDSTAGAPGHAAARRKTVPASKAPTSTHIGARTRSTLKDGESIVHVDAANGRILPSAKAPASTHVGRRMRSTLKAGEKTRVSTSTPAPPTKTSTPRPPSKATRTGSGGQKGGKGSGGKGARQGRTRSVAAYVPRYVLEGHRSAPFRRSRFARFVRALRPNVTVRVERNPAGLSSAVLYAPEPARTRSRLAYAPTALVSAPVRSKDTALVYRDSAYEIRVAGMSVKNYDTPFGDNELLMYSVHTDPTTTGDTNQSLPFIHYDHNRDATQNSDRINVFIPIPASKSYVTSSTPPLAALQSSSKAEGNGTFRPPGLKKSVNVQFRILELDEPNDLVKSAVKGIDELGGYISSFSPVAPLMGVLSPALGLASSVSKRALDSYAAPDKVISIDMDFLLADRARVRAGTSAPGEYLRYGYYFFLAEPVEGKLYASVRTPKNVQLMLKRLGGHRGKRYFPLTEISYLVVRVTEPTGPARLQRKPVQIEHAKQLENIFEQSKSDYNPEALRTSILNLGRSLGMIDNDSEAGTPRPVPPTTKPPTSAPPPKKPAPAAKPVAKH